MSDVLALDHVMYGAPQLEEAVDFLAVRTGVRAARGGRHTAFGTHNALLALGPSAYLEIIAPDPDRDPAVRPTIFGLDELTEPRLVGWCVRAAGRADLEARVEAASRAGIELGLREGERHNPGGYTLRWLFTDPYARPFDGVLPVLIDWLDTPHPARSAPGGLRLLRLTGSHPRVDAVRDALAMLGVDLEVARAPEPGLRATLEGPVGRVELT